MIFNEIYSAYYNTVAKIIAAVIAGNTDDKTINKIVSENAFGESVLTVMPSLKSEKWQLISADMTTPLKHKPTLPLTLTQKQWLKAISLDPRIKLFGIEFSGLDDVEPMFTSDDYVIYDKYGDGDPFEDEKYIERFKIILLALKKKHALKIWMLNRKDKLISMTVMPKRLEYSEKGDKFRLIGVGNKFDFVINLARISSCEEYVGVEEIADRSLAEDMDRLTLRIIDERNALERCLLHFAHFEKRAERVDAKSYLVHITYSRSDETEMVIRILSFGPMVEVVGPSEFKNLIIARLKSQKSCELI